MRKLILQGDDGKCLKRKMKTKREAKKVLKQSRRRGFNEFYECRVCGYYHLSPIRTDDDGNYTPTGR